MSNQFQTQDRILEMLLSLSGGFTQPIWYSIEYFRKEVRKLGDSAFFDEALDALSDLEYVELDLKDGYKVKLRISPVGKVFYESGNRFWELVPAANRIVTLDHNQRDVVEISEILQELADALENSNDIGDMSGEELEVARNEIAHVQSYWSAARIRIDEFRTFALRTLKWVSEKAAGAAVADLAKRALEMIARQIF